MIAYWFSDNGKPQWGPQVYEVRPEPYVQEGTIVPCMNGLHASAHPYDALLYASLWNLPTLDLVDLGGTVISHPGLTVFDKFAASHRTHLKRINPDKIFQDFARWFALELMNRSTTHCPQVVLDYLKSGDESQREAARNSGLPHNPPDPLSFYFLFRVLDGQHLDAIRRFRNSNLATIALQAQRDKFLSLVESAFEEIPEVITL